MHQASGWNVVPAAARQPTCDEQPAAVDAVQGAAQHAERQRARDGKRLHEDVAQAQPRQHRPLQGGSRSGVTLLQGPAGSGNAR